MKQLLIAHLKIKGVDYDDLIKTPDIPLIRENDVTPIDTRLDFDYLLSDNYPVGYNHGMIYSQLPDSIITLDIIKKRVFKYTGQDVTVYKKPDNQKPQPERYHYQYPPIFTAKAPDQNTATAPIPQIRQVFTNPNVEKTIPKKKGEYQTLDSIIRTYSELDRTTKDTFLLRYSKFNNPINLHYQINHPTNKTEITIKKLTKEYKVLNFEIRLSNNKVIITNETKNIVINIFDNTFKSYGDEISPSYDKTYQENLKPYANGFYIWNNGSQNKLIEIPDMLYTTQSTNRKLDVYVETYRVIDVYLQDNRYTENNYSPSITSVLYQYQPTISLIANPNDKPNDIVTYDINLDDSVTKEFLNTDFNTLKTDETNIYNKMMAYNQHLLENVGLRHMTTKVNHGLYTLDFTVNTWINLASMIGIKNASSMNSEKMKEILEHLKPTKDKLLSDGMSYDVDRQQLQKVETI